MLTDAPFIYELDLALCYILPVPIQNTLAIAGDDVAELHATGQQQADCGNVGGPGAHNRYLDLLHSFTNQLERVDQAG